MIFVFQGSLRNALFYKGLQLQEYGAERFRLIQDILLSRVHLAAVRPDLIDEINTQNVSVILGGPVRNPDFAKDHIDVEVKAGKVITAIKAQSIHDKPGDPRTVGRTGGGTNVHPANRSADHGGADCPAQSRLSHCQARFASYRSTLRWLKGGWTDEAQHVVRRGDPRIRRASRWMWP